MTKRTTKHYIGSIVEHTNGYEFRGEFLFSAATAQERKRVLRRIEREYRDATDIEQEAATWREIPAKDFAVLSRYLSVLG